MISFLSLCGLDVLSKNDCCIIGKIKHVFFDKNCKKIAYFSLDNTNEWIVPFSQIKHTVDIAVIDNTIKLLHFNDIDVSSIVLAMGKRVYSSFGEYKGEITDVFFDEKGKVLSFNLLSQALYPKDIKGVGDVVVLKDNKSQKNQKLDFSALAINDNIVELQSKDKTNTLASNDTALPINQSIIQTDNTDTSSTSNETQTGELLDHIADTDAKPTSANQQNTTITIMPQQNKNIVANSQAHTPPRIIADYNFLLGRMLTDNLFSYTGKLIAKANSFITIEIVENARAYGKLLELTLNSK